MADCGAEKTIRIILDDAEFTYAGKNYKIIKNEKPSPETKTDFFIIAKDLKTNNKKQFKISYKRKSYSFTENKIKKDRCIQIFDNNWSEILKKQILQENDEKINCRWKKKRPKETLSDSFRNFPLIDFTKKK